jgi:NAD(P)-dependent dehydrogenase (short-subunit alcohol dehydrogenase family)
MPLIALIGANGSLGREVVSALLADKENTVLAIVRNPETFEPWVKYLKTLHDYVSRRLIVRKGDVMKRSSLNGVFTLKEGETADCVVNCTGGVQKYNDAILPGWMFPIKVNPVHSTGTRNILQEMKSCGMSVGRYVVISSSANDPSLPLWFKGFVKPRYGELYKDMRDMEQLLIKQVQTEEKESTQWLDYTIVRAAYLTPGSCGPLNSYLLRDQLRKGDSFWIHYKDMALFIANELIGSNGRWKNAEVIPISP